jgi:hypothetical protein
MVAHVTRNAGSHCTTNDCMSVFATLLLLQTTTIDPVGVMDRYWAQLSKAREIRATLRFPGYFGAPDKLSLYVLTRPATMRVDEKTFNVRWSQVEGLGNAFFAPGGEMVPAMFEPLFGQKRFDQPRVIVLPEMRKDGKSSPNPLVALDTKDKAWRNITIYLDPKSALPVREVTAGNQAAHTTFVERIEMN